MEELNEDSGQTFHYSIDAPKLENHTANISVSTAEVIQNWKHCKISFWKANRWYWVVTHYSAIIRQLSHLSLFSTYSPEISSLYRCQNTHQYLCSKRVISLTYSPTRHLRKICLPLPNASYSSHHFYHFYFSFSGCYFTFQKPEQKHDGITTQISIRVIVVDSVMVLLWLSLTQMLTLSNIFVCRPFVLSECYRSIGACFFILSFFYFYYCSIFFIRFCFVIFHSLLGANVFVSFQ